MSSASSVHLCHYAVVKFDDDDSQIGVQAIAKRVNFKGGNGFDQL